MKLFNYKDNYTFLSLYEPWWSLYPSAHVQAWLLKKVKKKNLFSGEELKEIEQGRDKESAIMTGELNDGEYLN